MSVPNSSVPNNQTAVSGSSTVLAITVHGWGGSPRSWDPVAFPANWIVTPYTLPGHDTRRDDGPFEIPSAGEDLTGFIIGARTARPNLPVVLIAHSMGGQLSAWVNARHPDLIDGEVVIDPAYNGLDDPDSLTDLRDVLNRLQADPYGTMHQFLGGARSKFLPEDRYEAIEADIERTNPQALPDYFLSEYFEPGAFGLIGHTREVTGLRTKPVLGFYTTAARGEAERACDPAGLPVEISVWEGGHGHFMHQEDPDRFIGETERWVDALDAVRANKAGK